MVHKDKSPRLSLINHAKLYTRDFTNFTDSFLHGKTVLYCCVVFLCVFYLITLFTARQYRTQLIATLVLLGTSKDSLAFTIKSFSTTIKTSYFFTSGQAFVNLITRVFIIIILYVVLFLLSWVCLFTLLGYSARHAYRRTFPLQLKCHNVRSVLYTIRIVKPNEDSLQVCQFQEIKMSENVES